MKRDTPAKGFPWREWYAHAVIGLRLQPADFWGLSLTEWLWLTAPIDADSLDIKGLTALMQRYPDIQKTSEQV